MGLSTHILNTHLGRPAANVAVTLSQFRDSPSGGVWHKVASAHTDSDGRCKALLGDQPLIAGEYMLRFDTGSYFQDLRETALYPYVEIIFTIADPAQHYHIPLLLTANGYTTYRGS